MIACPSDAPEWVSANLAALNLPELGPKYLAAVQSWILLEGCWDYDANKGASAKGSVARPDLLDKWIWAGRAPRVKRLPAVSDIHAFENNVWQWWSSLQPVWRKMDADGRPSEDRDVEMSADWGILSIHGQNGLLNAVAVSCWWGMALDGRGSRSWERFLDDIIWVCEEQAESA
ncbi:hypothetical protein BD626DRAFT_551559 [Schizophyllum amplum]|uniref:Uncharacterized protein n=1 Tax=Schizophyllum amplum TaxID=97359 RepID=A0A550BV67_9AGAR|nr:hypothetical protein BD626DRAFT_551559 [Auriculariopsis ampla]